MPEFRNAPPPLPMYDPRVVHFALALVNAVGFEDRAAVDITLERIARNGQAVPVMCLLPALVARLAQVREDGVERLARFEEDLGSTVFGMASGPTTMAAVEAVVAEAYGQIDRRNRLLQPVTTGQLQGGPVALELTLCWFVARLFTEQDELSWNDWVDATLREVALLGVSPFDGDPLDPDGPGT